MGWGNYLVTTSDPNLLDQYLAYFGDVPVVTVDRRLSPTRSIVLGYGLVLLVRDGCGHQQCAGRGPSLVVDLDSGTTLCANCRRERCITRVSDLLLSA